MIRIGKYKLHSGEETFFKICEEDFTDEEIAGFVRIAVDTGIVPRFRSAEPVETGGHRIAKALNEYQDWSSDTYIIADDVLTTGNSIRKVLEDFPSLDMFALVLFARRPWPKDIPGAAIFTLTQGAYI